MKLYLSFFVFVTVLSAGKAQNIPDGEETAEILLSSSEENPESDVTDADELIPDFEYLSIHPLNLNSATPEELDQCRLFSAKQVFDLIRHREKFGKLLAIEELQVINSFGEDFIRGIRPYITVNRSIDAPTTGLKEMMRNGDHIIIARLSYIPETKRGYKKENGIKKYEGSSSGVYLRYRFRYLNKLSICLVAEKDPGESFFSGSNKSGFDFYSGHISISDAGIFKRIVIGDYKLFFGQGLNLAVGASGSKPADPVLAMKGGGGIIPASSVNEYSFKRGIAFSLSGKHMHSDFFVSYKKIDGSGINTDTLSGENAISGMTSSGYHRTESEIKGKGIIDEKSGGLNVSYKSGGFRTGMITSVTKYSLGVPEGDKAYNRYYFSGSKTMNSGLYFNYIRNNTAWFGEYSTDINGNSAGLGGLTITADRNLVLTMLARYYSKEYVNPNCGSFMEGGRGNNEKGIYGGFSWSLSRKVNLTASYDYWYSGWLKYRTDAPSSGSETTVLLSVKPDRKSEFYIRYKRKQNELNNSTEEDIKNVVPQERSGLRVHFATPVSDKFAIRVRGEFSEYSFEKKRENGFMIFSDIRFRPLRSIVTWSFRYIYFDTPGYDSRIYAYENDVLYGYSMPAYFYNGSRVCVNARCRLSNDVDLWLKYAVTFYHNREIIGSGWEEIEGNRKSEIKVQFVADI